MKTKIFCDSADYETINQITNFGKSFNQLTLETVKGFLNDSKKSKFRL